MNQSLRISWVILSLGWLSCTQAVEHGVDSGPPTLALQDAGEIVLRDGRVVGSHDGIEHFTIGQRKGQQPELPVGAILGEPRGRAERDGRWKGEQVEHVARSELLLVWSPKNICVGRAG